MGPNVDPYGRQRFKTESKILRQLSSGMLHLVVSWKWNDVSEVM